MIFSCLTIITAKIRSVSDFLNVFRFTVKYTLLPYNLVDFEVLETKEMSSDHYPISAVFDLKSKKQDRVKSNQLNFDYKRANWELFKEELDNTTLQTDTSIEELELNIRSKILDAAMKSVPTFNFKNSNSSLPNNIIELIKERRLIRNEIRKHKKKRIKRNITS